MDNLTAQTVKNLEKLRSSIPASRFGRLMVQPYKVLYPYVMRRFGSQRPVSLDTPWGGKFDGVLPEAVTTMLWRFGYYDYFLSRTLLSALQPGGVFIDVGAHFGYVSLLASHLVGDSGKVVCVEAMPTTYSYLKNNFEKNAKGNNALLLNCAAFDKEATLTFTDYGIVASSLNSAFGARGSLAQKAEGKSVEVRARTVDSIVKDAGLERVDVVKIDAESAEVFVLKGMKSVIERLKPVVITEVGDIADSDGPSSIEQIDIMAAHGYRPWKWDKDGKLKVFALSGPVGYANLIFIHENSDALSDLRG